MANELKTILAVIAKNPEAMLNSIVDAFEKDFSTFAKGNNETPLRECVNSLTKAKLHKAVASALIEARKASGLAVGYIGAKSGPFSKQPEEVQAPFIAAIDNAVTAFRASLVDSGLFAEKPEKTEAEKAEAKEKRETEAKEKLEKLKDEVRADILKSGEFVSVASIKPALGMDDVLNVVVNNLKAGAYDPDQVSALVEALKAYNMADTGKASKASKANKASKASKASEASEPAIV